jgi:hypothetical protein
LLGFQLFKTTITNALLRNSSTLSMASIRMINVPHTKLETHGGQHGEAQVDPSMMHEMFL